jgi:hypothetical protein
MNTPIQVPHGQHRRCAFDAVATCIREARVAPNCMAWVRSRRAGRLVSIAGVLCSTACGGLLTGQASDGGAGDEGAADVRPVVDAASKDAATDHHPESGWTQCSAPGGLRVCGGAYCPTGPSTDKCVTLFPAGIGCKPGSAVDACVIAPKQDSEFGSCFLPSDGKICLGPGLLSAPYDMGVLFAKNGGAARVSYADNGLWTDAALPDPASCPTEKGFQLCGPHCAQCPSSQVCTGRSPLHPYGLCVPTHTANYCRNGCDSDAGPGGCLIWLVEAQAQKLADENAFCMPLPQCQAAAAGYPGGGVQCIAADAGGG